MTDNTGRVLAPRSLRNGTAGALVGLTAAMLLPGQAFAQDKDPEELATIQVEDTAIDPNPNAEVGVPYKAKTSGDERITRPLAETPLSITVLTKSQIDDSGYTDLSRILDAQPGITVGTGENGNAFGDRYIIRGQEARSDVFVDGLRDPGMTTRESFVIEQLEISKGPNSSFAGRGTSGGAINAITKQATTSYNFGEANISLGSDRFVRATADLNYSTGESFAVRANALYHYQHVPDRGPANRRRTGGAVSLLYTPADNFSITLDYYGLRAKDLPDLGTYLVTDASGDRRPAKGTPVYAQEQDFQNSDVDTFTSRIKYAFSDSVRISNLTRYGTSDNAYYVTGARGATALASGTTPAYATITLSSHQGWQEVEYFANQTNLYWDSEMLGGKNQLVLGAEYTNHKVRNGVYANTNTGAPNCRTSGTGAFNTYCAVGPDGRPVNGINTLLGRVITRGTWDTNWKVETISAYLLDTVDLTPALTLFLGGRLDHFKFDLLTQNTTSLDKAAYEYSDTLWNGYAGLTYKVGGGILYATIATAADINGGESDVGTNGGYGGALLHNGKIAGAKPERSISLELGSKWNLFDEKLLFTAAVFQSTKSDVMEGEGYTNVGTFNSGKNRVRGVEFTLAGNVTPEWTIQGGVTLMYSKVLASATPANVGKMLSNFAKNSAQFQTKYQFTPKFSMGAAVKYESARYAGQPDTAAAFTTLPTGGFAYSQPVPAYTVGDLFASYDITQTMKLAVNINNITDADYYLAAYRSGSFVYIGDARSVRATLSIDF